MTESEDCRKDEFSMEEEEKTLNGGQACAECTMNCLLTHAKERNPYSSVNRFFKVMLGDDFSDVLFLPPRFARTASDFVNQEAYLEDSLGQKYKVTFSKIDDSLAFQKGWHEFSVEHGLEEGDFLVFHHIRHNKKYHSFVVHILGKSGCEKLNFPHEIGVRRKRSKISANAAAPDEACKRQDMKSASTSAVSKSHFGNSQSQLMNINNSPNFSDAEKLQLVPSIMEEPLYMLNRDAGENRDDRMYLYDLSSFENQGNSSAAIETNRIVNGGEGTANLGEKHMKSQSESVLVDNFCDMRDISCSETPRHGGEFDIDENIEEPAPVNGTSDIRGTAFTLESAEKSYKKNPCLNSDSIAKQEDGGVFCHSDPTASALVHKEPSGEMMKEVKKELVESRENSCGPPQLLTENMSTIGLENAQSPFSINENDKIMKTELVDSLDISTPFAAASPCVVVVDDEPFLTPSTQEVISSMVAHNHPPSCVQTGTPHSQLPPIPSKEGRVDERQSSNGSFAPASEDNCKQGYTSFQNGVSKPLKQLVVSGSESLAAVAFSETLPMPAAAADPDPDPISHIVVDSGSDSDSQRRMPTLSEVLKSIKKKRKRDFDK